MRRTYIDNIRWITVVLVVVYHVIFMYNGVMDFAVAGPFSEVQYQDGFLYAVYPWFMLLLFTVSGMSAGYYLEKHTDKEFFRSRTVKCLVPSTLGVLVFGWATGYFSLRLSGVYEEIRQVPSVIRFVIMDLSGTGPLWFIQLLWVYSLLLVIFRKADKGRFYGICSKTGPAVLAALFLVIWGSAQILNMPVITVYRIGIYGAGYFAGYLVLSHNEVMERLEKWWILFSAAAVICGIVFVIMYRGMNYADAEVLETFMCNLYAWAGTLGILSFMKKFGDFENTFTGWMSKKSWGLYLFHYLPVAVCGWYVKSCSPQMPAVMVYIVTAIAAFGVSLIIYEIFSRIPVIRWCVCGIGGKKK